MRDLIEATGAHLLYLPPYSPDFNPIENMFSKLKALFERPLKHAPAPAAASLAPSSVRCFTCRKVGGRTRRPWQALALTLFRSARSGGTTSFADCGSELNWLAPFRPLAGIPVRSQQGKECANSGHFLRSVMRAQNSALSLVRGNGPAGTGTSRNAQRGSQPSFT